MQNIQTFQDTSGGDPDLPPSEQKDGEIDGVVSSEDIARNLGALSAFLRNNAGDEVAQDIDTSASSARIFIEENSNEDEQAVEKENLPLWGKDITNTDKVFVELADTDEIWHVIAESTGKNNELMTVKYQFADNILTPGATKNEQAIELDNIDNTFTLDEWIVIVKPIMDRYVKSLELRRLNKSITNKKNKYKNRFKTLLPQVFLHKEYGDINEKEILSKEFSTKINELLNEVNTNPDVLKDWISTTLEGKESAKIDKSRFGSQKYGKLHTDSARKRLLQRFNKTEDSLDNYINDLTDKISKIGAQILNLNSSHKEGLYSVNEVKKDFEETPYMQKKLAELTEKVALQLERGKGMVSMIGDMGTGKNYIVEHFAAKTNRPFFYFPCSRGMDAADLGFHFEFRKNESFIVPSALARGLRTKNACILIDEPNSLPPEVVSALHGLADHNRSFVYNGVEFKAAEGVTIIMTMNPATYEHVKDMPEAMSDRTLGQDMILDYPPLTKLDELAQDNLWSNQELQEALQSDNSLDKIFVCDEALILKNYIPELKDWTSEEFIKLWNVIVNEEGESILGNKADDVDQLKSFVTAISNILKVCQKWRNKYKSGDMMRTISVRGSIAVVENFLRTKDVKKAFLDLYKPNSKKYDGGEEDYENLEQVMNDMQELQISINDVQ